MDKILGRFKEGFGFKLIVPCAYIVVFSLVFFIIPLVMRHNIRPQLEMMSPVLLAYSLLCLVFLAALLSSPNRGYLKSVFSCGVVVFIAFTVVSFDYRGIERHEFNFLSILFVLLSVNSACFRVVADILLPEEAQPPGYDWTCSACSEANAGDAMVCEACNCPSVVSASKIKSTNYST